MAALSMNIFITSLFYLYVFVDGRFMVVRTDEETFQPKCSKMCNSSTEDPSGELIPRYQCSCSKSCVVYGDCCYDSPFRNATTRREQDFVCLSVVKRGKFRAVSSCPPDQRFSACRDELGHLPPVTSKITNITYGNLFCAMCNGDADEPVTWSVQMRCHSDDENEGTHSIDDSDRIIYDSNEFWRLDEVDGTKTPCKYHIRDDDDSSFLDGLELRSCSTQTVISKCSPSWKDVSYVEKCRSYEDPVYFHDTAYRNLQCAECNFLNTDYADCAPFYVKNMLQMELPGPKISDFCRRRGSDNCIRSLPDLERGSLYPPSEMFRDCNPPDCCVNHKVNPRTGKCRRFTKG